MKIAIITGASSGLGEEYVKCVAGGFADIDEIWAIARREERLKALSDRYPGKKIVPVPLDLTDYDSYDALEKRLAEYRPEVGILINNAGFGTLGNFDTMELHTQARMVDLNNRALTAVTSAVLPYMKKGDFIVNVCSIAAFAPNPRMTVYCSTKAYVYSFSKSLRFELKPRGINVLAVCPGPMDTEFLPVAGINKGASHTFDTLPRCNPVTVAERSLKRAAAGHGKYTPKVFYKFYHLLSNILPHSLVMHMSKA